jgi:hypothetical protein
MSDRRGEIVADKHEIETLQRLYAKATDKLAMDSAEVREEGREIYRRIFAPDVQVRTLNTRADMVSDGPDGWAGKAANALKDYIGTQHLIGTQLTEVDGDEGEMESYLNAWHKNTDGSVYYFLGTYISKVRRYEEGWKIYDMTLRLDTSGTAQTT